MSQMTPLYLESDEEITSVIDKIKASKSDTLAIIPAKNSPLLQSLINLKLIAKESHKTGKRIVLISSSKISQRIARQAGLEVFSHIGSVNPSVATKKTDLVAPKDTPLPEGVRVKQYQPPNIDKEDDNLDEDAGTREPASLSRASAGRSTLVVEKPLSSAEPTDNEPISSTGVGTVRNDSYLDDQTNDSQPAEVAKISQIKPITSTHSTDLPPAVSRSSLSPSRSIRISWRYALLVVGLVLVLLGISAVFLPRATVTITFPATKIEDEELISIKPDSTENGVLAGILLSSEQSTTKEITATGKKDIGTKSTGTISITNKYTDSNKIGKSQTFTSGTLVTDSKTKTTFVLNSTVTVGAVTYNPQNGEPIYQTKTVEVTASEPGESSNVVSGSTFTLSGALPNTVVTNSAAFSGGSSKQVNVLSQADVDKAISETVKELKAKAAEELKTKSNEKQYFEDSIFKKIVTSEWDKKVDEQTNTAKLKMTVVYSVISFEKSLAEKVLIDKMKTKIKAGNDLVLDSSIPIELTYQSSDADKNTLKVLVKGAGFEIKPIDRNAIAQSIKFKSDVSAESVIKSQYGAESALFNITPSWWPRLPLLTNAIKIEFGFDEVSGT